MSLNEKDLIEGVDALDSGNDENTPEDLKQDYQAIVEAVNYIGEEEFKSKLDQIHSNMNSGTFFGKNAYWISGIAAAMIGAFFWWQSVNPEMVSPQLQMNEMPVYGDSATYDSLKNVESPVDKEDETVIK